MAYQYHITTNYMVFPWLFEDQILWIWPIFPMIVLPLESHERALIQFLVILMSIWTISGSGPNKAHLAQSDPKLKTYGLLDPPASFLILMTRWTLPPNLGPFQGHLIDPLAASVSLSSCWSSCRPLLVLSLQISWLSRQASQNLAWGFSSQPRHLSWWTKRV